MRYKNWYVLTFVLLFFISCRKDTTNQLPASNPIPGDINKPAASTLPNMYFDVSSNPSTVIPSQFSSADALITFFKEHFRQIADPAGKKATVTTGAMTTLDDPPPPASQNFVPAISGIVFNPSFTSSSASDFHALSNVCQAWLTGNFAEYSWSTTPSQADANGATTLLENIQASYTPRGIICVISFGVKYAPSTLHSSKPYVYSKAYEFPAQLVITGGALGTMDASTVGVVINSDGSGTANATQTETRTQILTSNNTYIFKAGEAKNFPVGMKLDNGLTVKTSINSITRYILTYSIQFLAIGANHQHSWDQWTSKYVCSYSGQLPVMSYTDMGSEIVGVPQN